MARMAAQEAVLNKDLKETPFLFVGKDDFGALDL
jgi:hypothetical protein